MKNKNAYILIMLFWVILIIPNCLEDKGETCGQTFNESEADISTITAWSWTNETLTMTTSGGHNLNTGNYVRLARTSPVIDAVYLVNGIVDSNNFTISYPSDPGTFVSGTVKTANDSIQNANSFGIILKKGCKVIIKGSISEYTDQTSDSDYFRVNPGDVTTVRLILKWDNFNMDLDSFIKDEDDGEVENGFGANDVERFDWEVDQPFFPQFIEINAFTAAADNSTNYTLTIEGL